MRATHLHRLLCVTAGTGLLALSGTNVLAQEQEKAGAALTRIPQGQLIRKELPATRIQASEIKVNAKTPIAFQAFPLVDPKTRKAVGPNDMITRPDGKQVPAGEYYAQLNALEQDLNKQGHSLKSGDKAPVLKSVIIRPEFSEQAKSISAEHKVIPNKVMIQRVQPGSETVPMEKRAADAPAFGLNAQQFQSAQTQVKSMSIPNTGAQMLTLHSVQTDTFRSKLLSDAVLKNLVLVINPVPQPKVVNKSYGWNWSVGSASTFQAYVRAKLSLNGEAYPIANPSDAEIKKTKSHFTLHSEATAGGSLFNHSLGIIRATADFKSSASGNNANIDVAVLGQSVYNLSESKPSSWSKSDTLSKGCDFHTTIPIPISIFTLNVTLGAQGEAGIKYGIFISSPLPYVHGWVDPFVHTRVYAQAGVGIGGSWLGAEAGVGASMNLLNYDMDIDGEFGIIWFINFGMFEKINVHNKLEALSGRVYAYAKVNHPCFPDVWNSCSNQLTVDLWSWSGLKTEGDLLSYNASQPLK